jgi:hypothetical protein
MDVQWDKGCEHERDAIDGAGELGDLGHVTLCLLVRERNQIG